MFSSILPPQPNGPTFTLTAGDRPYTAWNHDDTNAQFVQIYIERKDTPGVDFVRGDIPAIHLFNIAPGLQQHMVDTGRILVPGRQIHELTLDHVLLSIVRSAQNSTPFCVDVVEHPIHYIRLHVILVLLGISKEANILLDRMWQLFERFELNVNHVLWIWETFGADSNRDEDREWPIGPYRAPYGGYYIQLVAYQVVNMRKICALNSNVQSLVWSTNFGKQTALRGIVEQREKVYGLLGGFEPPGKSAAKIQEHKEKDKKRDKERMNPFERVRISHQWDEGEDTTITKSKAWTQPQPWQVAKDGVNVQDIMKQFEDADRKKKKEEEEQKIAAVKEKEIAAQKAMESRSATHSSTDPPKWSLKSQPFGLDHKVNMTQPVHSNIGAQTLGIYPSMQTPDTKSILAATSTTPVAVSSGSFFGTPSPTVINSSSTPTQVPNYVSVAVSGANTVGFGFGKPEPTPFQHPSTPSLESAQGAPEGLGTSAFFNTPPSESPFGSSSLEPARPALAHSPRFSALYGVGSNTQPSNPGTNTNDPSNNPSAFSAGDAGGSQANHGPMPRAPAGMRRIAQPKGRFSARRQ